MQSKQRGTKHWNPAAAPWNRSAARWNRSGAPWRFSAAPWNHSAIYPLESLPPLGIVQPRTVYTYVCMKAWCGENVNGLLWWKSNYILKTGLTLLYVRTGSICVYCLQNLNTKGPGFEALPESFGDICWKYKKLLWKLLDLKAKRAEASTSPRENSPSQ